MLTKHLNTIPQGECKGPRRENGLNYGARVPISEQTYQWKYWRKFKMVNTDSHSTDMSVSHDEGRIEQFYWLITFFGFNWGQSYLATLVTRQNCTIMLRNLRKFLFPQATFEQLSLQKATFDCFLSNFWATVWEVTGNFLENLEQLVESPSFSSEIYLTKRKTSADRFQFFDLWKYYFWNLHKICFLVVVLLS